MAGSYAGGSPCFLFLLAFASGVCLAGLTGRPSSALLVSCLLLALFSFPFAWMCGDVVMFSFGSRFAVMFHVLALFMTSPRLQDVRTKLPSALREYGSVSRPASVLSYNQWSRLSEEAARLIESKQLALESVGLRNSAQEWCGLCDFGLPVCAERASVFERALNVGAVARGFGDLRLGLGSLGYNGCLHVGGNCIRWSIFDNASLGIVAAMTRLDIHILGLPCARLPEGFTFPERYGLKYFARGGPSYSSCAVSHSGSTGCSQLDLAREFLVLGLACQFTAVWLR